MLEGPSGVKPSAGSAGKVGWLEHPELAYPFLKPKEAPETRQETVGMSCPAPADQGVAQARLVDAKGFLCPSLVFAWLSSVSSSSYLR